MNKRFWAMILAFALTLTLTGPMTVFAVEDEEAAITNTASDSDEANCEEETEVDVSLPETAESEGDENDNQTDAPSSSENVEGSVNTNDSIESNGAPVIEEVPSEEEPADTNNDISTALPDTETSAEKTYPVDDGLPAENEENPENEDGQAAANNPDEGIEPAAAAGTKLYSFSIVSISGTGKVNMTDTAVKEKTFSYGLASQDYNKSTVHAPNFYFDLSKPIVITYYRHGFGNIDGFESYGKPYSITNGRNWNFTYGSDGGAVAWNTDMNLGYIDPAVTEINLHLTGTSKDVYDRVEFVRDISLKFINERGPAPTAPEFVLSSDKEHYVLEGVDSSMEYRKGITKTWTSCKDEPMEFAIPSSNTNYQVRYKAVDGGVESNYKELVLPVRPSAPAVSINWVDESFKGLTTDMVYSFAGSEYSPVTESMIESGISYFLDQVTGPDPAALLFRNPATESKPASNPIRFNLYPRGNEPTGLTVNPNTYVVSGVNNTMQYLGPGDTAWRNISVTAIDMSYYARGDQEAQILFRTKATNTTAISKSVAVTLPRLASAPVLSLDYKNEKVTGFQSNLIYQYRTGTGSWRALNLTNQEAFINGLISGSADVLLSIRAAATDTSRLTDAWQVTLPKRVAAPSTVSFVYNDAAHVGRAVLTGVSSDYEYQLKGTTEWISCDSSQVVFDLPTAGKTYYIRLKSTASSFASYNRALTLYAPGSAPTNSLNMTTETLTIAATIEYRIDNSSYTTLPSGTTAFVVTDLINALSGSDTRQITIRFAATAVKPASKEKVITLVARRAAPNTVVYNASNQTVSGTTSAMQYRVAGAASWLNISKTSFSVASLLNGNTNVVLEFRFKPTSALVGSYIQQVICS